MPTHLITVFGAKTMINCVLRFRVGLFCGYYCWSLI